MTTKKEKQKANKVTIIILAIIICNALVLSGYIAYQTVFDEEDKEEIEADDRDLPVCFLMSEASLYNKMLPLYNEIDPYTMTGSICHSLNNEMTIAINHKNISNVSVELIDKNLSVTEEIIEINDDRLQPYEKGVQFKVQFSHIKKNYAYVMKINLTYEERSIYYYQNIIGGNIDEKDLINQVNQLHQWLFKGDESYEEYITGRNSGGTFYALNQNSHKDLLTWSIQNVVKSSDVIYEIKMAQDYYQVDASFTVSYKVDNDYRFCDFVESYIVDYNGRDIKIIDYERVGDEGYEPIYDEDKKGWMLDNKNGESTMLTYSNNQKYCAFEYKGELWFNDVDHNELIRLYTQGVLDDDYLIDESQLYGFHINQITNEGNVVYLKMGYQGWGEYLGYNGIEICYYNHFEDTNDSIGFIPFDMWHENLLTYVEGQMVYNDAIQKGYIDLNGQIYTVDFLKKEIKWARAVNAYETIDFFGHVIYNHPSHTENYSLTLSNLYDSQDYLINYENDHIRLLDVFDEGLLIGKYLPNKTYEYLDTDIFYPCDEIVLIDYEGKEIKNYKPESGLYYGEASPLADLSGLKIPIYEFYHNPYISEYDDIGYKRLETIQVQLPLHQTKIKNEKVMINPIEGEEVILPNANQRTRHREYIDLLVTKQEVNVFDELKESNYYELIVEDKIIDRINQLEGLLNSEMDLSKLSVLYVPMSGERCVLFHAVEKNQKHLEIDDSNISSKVRSEIKALMILLNQREGITYSASEVVSSIKQDITTYQVEDAIVHYGNMHKGYVGDFEESAVPELGVYIEPLVDCGKQLTAEQVYGIKEDNSQNIKYFVDNNYKILYIYINQLHVLKEDIQVIKTPYGYMETSQLQEGIVVTGYDAEFIYYYHAKNQQYMKDDYQTFEQKIKHLGGQGIVIIEALD